MADSTQAWELSQRIQNSEGERLSWKMEGLRAIYFIFSGNYVELVKSMEYFEQAPNVQFLPVEKREAMRAFQRDNMRLLHNFLASAFTLVDHTRILVSELYKDQFKNEYQRKVQEVFGESGLAGFVKGLRNWMLHKGLIPVLMQATVDNNEKFISSIVLDIEKLKSWDGWTPRARAYLSTAGPHVGLRDVVKPYHDQVEQFYLWLGGRMLQVHAAAFKELAELEDQYRAVRPQI